MRDQAESSGGTYAPTRGHTLDIERLTHRYGSFTAVDDVTLAVRAGEIVALLGPSGCGKTTLLRVIAGFIAQASGRVLIDGRPIDALPANRRSVGIVFQNYALFPHMTAGENVAYGLAARGRPRAEIAARVEAMLAAVRLAHLKGRMPRQLSGGQQQRVAFARALAIEPAILLLDEPFGALDKNLRLDLQIEIKRLQRQFGLTAILVTHDQDEAMSIADRIAVMNRGRIEQLDTPTAIYDRPATPFVNGFIGTTNILAGAIVAVAGGEARIRLAAGAELTVPAEPGFSPGQDVTVSIRPEQLALFRDPAPGRWPVEVGLVLPIGGNVVYEVTTASAPTPLKITETRRGAAAVGGPMHCGLAGASRPILCPANPDQPKEKSP
jgi:putative spermidine/putrescine transport system ATP-binding protein